MLFQPKSFRRSPFKRGRRYRVLKDFDARYDEPFRAGDLLVYHSTAHSIYDGMDGYFFTQTGSELRFRRWDVSTYEDMPDWCTLFELQPRRGWRRRTG